MKFTSSIVAVPILAILILAILFACQNIACAQTQTSSLPPAAASLSQADQKQMQAEIDLGQADADQIAKTEEFDTDPAVIKRVQTIGAKIAAVADVTRVKAGFGNDSVYPFRFTYHVIKSKEVNAFSLPGGFIYIYTGMLDLLNTDDELAAVLGHETAHAAHHHVVTLMRTAAKMNTQLLLATLAAVIAHVPSDAIIDTAAGGEYVQQAILNNHYSETAEEDADHTGMIYAQKAGFNPVGMYAMLMALKQTEDRSPDVELGYLRDHPYTGQRVAAAKAELASLGAPVNQHTLREAEGTMIATVTENDQSGKPVSETLMLGKGSLAVVAPAERQNALLAASELNLLLDQNLQLYEVKAQGSIMLARDTPILTFTPADVSLAGTSPTATPQSLAQTAATALQNALWQDAVVGTTEDEINVGDTVSAMP